MFKDCNCGKGQSQSCRHAATSQGQLWIGISFTGKGANLSVHILTMSESFFFIQTIVILCILYIHSSTWLMIMTRQSTPFYNLSKQISTKMLGLLQSRQRRSTSICLGMLAFKISLQPYIQTKQLKVSQR